MENIENIELNAAIGQDGISESRFVVIFEKLSKITRFVFFWINFATPLLFYLKEQHPKVAIFGLARNGLTLAAVPFILVRNFNGLSKKQEPKRCSKAMCSRCAARKHHPKLFSFKFCLIMLVLPCFPLYSAFRINFFFRDNQTIDLYRLFQLLGWQISVIVSVNITTFYYEQFQSHNGPLEVNSDAFEREAVVESKIV
ncbi:hypothetical protein SEUBUCD646_0A00880 [Saccharomyces eubayanus]|uniref:Uncharacterized protein n=1 Tax=Saccharomyces eubayanus TaxID=1080349 RepID=A0ABN8VQ00_SACEU|nr:hypothetical protein SEUBUCD650_0A00870 [Saccharomyces eubayanus]CAI1833908.1 hypothetical protein SEUBUCD646_0A00880 [Saccharomyces eubayanus]